jgi:hypothetical protein
MLDEGIYRVFGGLEFISDLLILREELWTLDKDLLRSLYVWTHENQIIFWRDSSSVEADWVADF